MNESAILSLMGEGEFPERDVTCPP